MPTPKTRTGIAIALAAATLVTHGVDAKPAPLGSLRPSVMDLALSAAACAQRAGAVADAATLTVIDYSLPSTAKRLWVIDLATHRLLFEELVSHGRGSGDALATRFSNTPSSYQSSLGLFVTAETYTGSNGYSLRLDGLEPGINHLARDRAIVMHGAPYVSETFAQRAGRLGRSLGCPALRQDVAHALIDRVKGGNLLFAYAEDPAWLRSSTFLGDCAAAAAD